MATYFILKRTYSEKIAHGNQPYVWKPKKISIPTIPPTKTGWNNLTNRIHRKHGSGTYRIMRSQFKGESSGWKPVAYFNIDHHKKSTFDKRYTQYRATTEKKQPFFKTHNKQHKIISRPKVCGHITF